LSQSIFWLAILAGVPDFVSNIAHSKLRGQIALRLGKLAIDVGFIGSTPTQLLGTKREV
jgi:hypothetical protein